MTSPVVMVANTPLITPNKLFTTPPTSLITGQSNAPSRPVLQLVEVWELYWMMTLTCVDVLLSSGSRSGEILELSAMAEPANKSARQRTAHRAIRVEHIRVKRFIRLLFQQISV